MLHRYGALTETSEILSVMSKSEQQAYIMPHDRFTGILVSVIFGSTCVLGVIVVVQVR